MFCKNLSDPQYIPEAALAEPAKFLREFRSALICIENYAQMAINALSTDIHWTIQVCDWVVDFSVIIS